MPKNYNGLIRDSLDMYKLDKKADGDLATCLEIFRGFEKVPRVICERIDIRPFLLKKLKMDDLAPDLREPTFVAVREISKFSKKCTVQLKRENLEKLKEEYKRYSNRDHVSDKQNVMYFTCNICQKVYLSEKKLLNHQENKHVLLIRPESKIRKKVSFSDEIIVHEVKEYHRCRKCPKIYEDYKSLRTHMKAVHKKRRCYICFYCSKDFVDRTFFKVHMKLHCDLCGLLFPNKKSYNEHRRESDTCKIIKKYECKTCHITLFHFLDLKDHSYEHLGNFYICDICKDRFDDKCALSHHIKFLHSKRRPRDLYTTQMKDENTIYTCNFCELTSSERASIEKHVSTFPEYEKCAMTGYSNFYFCDQCFEKFSTETYMLEHKWTHYLKTAEKNQQDTPTPVNLLNMEILSNSMNNEHQNNTDENTTEVSNNDVTQDNSNMKSQITLKRYYNINQIPAFFQPKIVLERLDLKKPIIAEKKKKTLSRHQCELCFKYLVNGYSVRRHMVAVHGIQKESVFALKKRTQGKLRCAHCEEDFALPSLLQNHNCIRINRPEPPFQDARPEIQFDTSAVYQHNGFDDIIAIDDEDDYMNSIDFDIPAPIVELTEYDNALVINNDESICNAPVDVQLVDVAVSNNTLNENSNNAAHNEVQFKRQSTNAVQRYCRFNPNTTVNEVRLNRPLIDDQLIRPLNSATGNVIRFNKPLQNTMNNNGQLKRLLNSTPVYDARFYRTLDNSSASNNNFNRPFNNAIVNNAQPNRLLNNAIGNDARFNRPLNNNPVNDARFITPLNHTTVNDARLNRPMNNTTVNEARHNRTLNGLTLNPSPNVDRINVQLNVGGKKNQYTLVVQEVPIEF